MDLVDGIHHAYETAVQMDSHGLGDMANRDLICLGKTISKTTYTKKIIKAITISWILTSWNGLKQQVCVCMCREPLRLFLMHSFSFWQSVLELLS